LTDIHQLRKAELAQLRKPQTAPSATPALTEAVAPAGVSERGRAEILAKIAAIETQMRAEWAAPASAAALRR
jgi:hypothetical protein